MIKLTRTGVGVVTHPGAIRDGDGSSLLPIQAESGGNTFRLVGRVSPEAPWFEIKAPAAANFLEAFSWVPYIQLEVTSGTGAVTVWIGEK